MFVKNDVQQKPKIEKGLKNVYITETELSDVNGHDGILTIKGYDVSELAFKATFEEVAYLLLYSKKPSSEELHNFTNTLVKHRRLNSFTIDAIKKAVQNNISGFETLQIALSTLFLTFSAEKKEQNEKIISAIPTILAYYWRLKNNKEIIEPRIDFNHVGNFLYMLDGQEPNSVKISALQTYLITVMDHGMNASTFVSRSISSSNSDLLSSVLGALGSLKGPLHGGAPGPVLEMVFDIHKSNDPEGYIKNALENGDRLMGFGHRIYKTRDPRADVLKKAGEKFYSTNEKEIDELFKKTEQIALTYLQKFKPGRQLHTNVEFYTAYLLHGIGIDKELFTCIFAMSRVVGWLAHAGEQQKETNLIRPESFYIGDYGGIW